MQTPQKGCKNAFDVSLNQKSVSIASNAPVATMDRNTLFNPTNLGYTPTNDLANDFAMVGLVHKTMIVL